MRETFEEGKHGDKYLRVYDHIGDVADRATKTLRTGDRYNCSSINGDYDFTQTDSLKEALDLLRYGWPEGTQAAKELLSSIDLNKLVEQFPQRFSQTTFYDVAGQEPDLSRFFANDPENMVNVVPDRDRIGSIAKILINASQHANVPAEQMRRRGVVVLGMIEALGRLGYSADVECYQLVTSSNRWGNAGDTHETHIPLLNAGSYANIDTVSFAISHPSFLRRVIFALEEDEPQNIREQFGFHNSSGYGQPHDLKPIDYEDPDAVHIGKDEALCRNDRAMTIELERLLRELFEKNMTLETQEDRAVW